MPPEVRPEMRPEMRTGPRNLITDVAGLRVGSAEDHRLKSGVTVLTGERPFLAAVDVMGGAPGTRETDLLAPGRLVEAVDAIVLSGGSAFGLDAASSVTDALARAGRGYPAGALRVPIVPAAILFDLANGGAKDWGNNPYRALGVAALAAASEDFALGSVGAGAGAMTASLMGGLGSASLALPSGETVGALVAVNAAGDVVAPGGREFWAAPFEIGAEFGGLGPSPRRAGGLPGAKPGALAVEATTLGIVATDAGLDVAGLQRMAVAAQAGLARAVVPSHTLTDGDLVFAVSTGRPGADLAPARRSLIGHAAALCLCRAAARAVFAATPRAGDRLPCWSGLGG
jgi:L-aminopeptidase/D-esterase-like protein